MADELTSQARVRLSLPGWMSLASVVAAAAEAEYPEVKGDYWKGTIRLLLADLYSSGLIRSLEEKIGADGDSKLHFRFELTEFGRERMADTRIAGRAPAQPATAEVS